MRPLTIAILLLATVWASVVAPPTMAQQQATDAEVLRALRERDVYVAPAARSALSEQAEAELQRYTRERAAAGTTIKLAVLDRPPAGFARLGPWVEAAHSALRLGDGILIAVAIDAGDGAGSVSAKTDALDKTTIERLQERNLGTFLAIGFADGMRALADDLIAETMARRASEQRNKQLFVLGVGAALLVVLLTIVTMLAASWARNLKVMRELQAGLYPLMRRLDDDLPYIADTPDGQRASDLQAEAAEAYTTGTQLADTLARVPRLRGGLPGPHWSQLGEATRAFELAKQRLTEAGSEADRALAAAGKRST